MKPSKLFNIFFHRGIVINKLTNYKTKYYKIYHVSKLLIKL